MAEQAIDREALFLAGLHWPNMFEERRDQSDHYAGWRCKVCEAIVATNEREAHHAEHRIHKSQYATEQIRARKERDMAGKTDKQTPAEQGVPAVYLNADGTKFYPPGMDARLKSDLIHAAEGWPNPKALHQFDGREASDLLAKRNWNEHRVKAVNARLAKEARDKAKSANKATAAKERATAKKTAGKAKVAEAATKLDQKEVTPDPKPTRAPRKARTLRSV